MPAPRSVLIAKETPHELEPTRSGEPLPHDRRSFQRILRLLGGTTLALLVVSGLLNVIGLAVQLSGQEVFHQDFLATYVLVRAIGEGADPYLPVQTLAQRYVPTLPYSVFPHPTPHPPTLGLVLWPLSHLDYLPALRLFVVVEFLCLVTAIYLIGRLARLRLSPLPSLAFAIAAVAWPIVRLELSSGQVQLLILALLAGALLAFQAERPILGGLVLGLTLLIKPIVVPVLLLLGLRRQWRALGASLAVPLAGYAVAGLILGVPTMLRYGTQVLPEVSAIYRNSAFNLSLWSLFSPRLYDEINGLRFLDASAPAVAQGSLGGAAVVPLGLLLGTLLLCWRMPLGWAFSVMAGVSVIVSPIAWSFYLVVVLLPLGQAAGWLVRRGYPRRQTALTAAVVTLLLIPHATWLNWAFWLAGRSWPSPGEGIYLFPFGAGLVTFGPTLAVGALIALTAMFGRDEAAAR